MSEVKTLKEIALELLEKYRLSETGLIWEISGQISEDMIRLEYECNYMRKQIEGIAEPKKGKWIAYKGVHPPEYHGLHYCSNCHHALHLASNGRVYNYCPRCGAKMEVEE